MNKKIITYEISVEVPGAKESGFKFGKKLKPGIIAQETVEVEVDDSKQGQAQLEVFLMQRKQSLLEDTFKVSVSMLNQRDKE